MPNHGLDWKRQLRELNPRTDHVLGADKKCIALIPMSLRDKYLPKGEIQRGKEDFMDCATRSVVNIAEAKFNYLLDNDLISPANKKWLTTKGYMLDGKVTFSDRYPAIKSKTTRQGNSLKAPCHAVHSWGLIPKKILPAKSTMTWVQYHDPKAITIEMDILGAQFRNRFPMFYELAHFNQFPFIIDEDMLDVAGHAWSIPVDGEYPYTPLEPNHAFVYFKTPRYYIFDNYIEAPNDFVKKLADTYKLMPFGYRIRFEEQEVEIDRALLDIILELLVRGKTAQALSFINRSLGSWLGFSR